MNNDHVRRRVVRSDSLRGAFYPFLLTTTTTTTTTTTAAPLAQAQAQTQQQTQSRPSRRSRRRSVPLERDIECANHHHHHPSDNETNVSSLCYGTAAEFASLVQQQQQRDDKHHRVFPLAKNEPSDELLLAAADDDDKAPTYVQKQQQHQSPSSSSLYHRLVSRLDPTPWLLHDALMDDHTGDLYFDNNNNNNNNSPSSSYPSSYSLAVSVRHYFYNPLQPEFTSLQQFNWAIVIGVVMGLYTALWKELLELLLQIVWVQLPRIVVQQTGDWLPLYHYMWITPSVFAAVLCYASTQRPIALPDQNEWIRNVHRRGVQDYRAFWPLFLLSTLGMVSGLSLGPELPLILTGGMFGSWLALQCRQSMLQARVMNLTAAGAAVAGFFGFPMAGALFVLELPHRMGLQYFEALSPATISSIVAVLINRLVTRNDVTGYYKYPFLTTTLPSKIFMAAILYGFYGALIGTVYVVVVQLWKHHVQELWREEPSTGSSSSTTTTQQQQPQDNGPMATTIKSTGILVDMDGEIQPLLVTTKKKPTKSQRFHKFVSVGWTSKKCKLFNNSNNNEPIRAALAGAVAGAMVGWIGIFLPHVMFWGEAQLQTLIDKGRTPLPIFGLATEPTAGLTSRGYCMIDASDEHAIRNGLDLGCSLAIALAKTVVTGLSLGTGIIGGNFWGPLFVGCSAGHFFVDVFNYLVKHFHISTDLALHPCVVILCVMGSAHVVVFRSHLAIMLILTLTISTFDSDDTDDPNGSTSSAGDYSAVFPLLVVSVFVSLMVTRGTIFYPTQRSRGDITAVPEVLCEPGMEGRPLVFEYDDGQTAMSNSSMESTTTDEEESLRSEKESFQGLATEPHDEATFSFSPPLPPESTIETSLYAPNNNSFESQELSMERLDELLAKPIESTIVLGSQQEHRRAHSALLMPEPATNEPLNIDEELDRRLQPARHAEKAAAGSPMSAGRSVSRSNSSPRGSFVRVASYGELQEHQPSLMDQARKRAATADPTGMHRRVFSHGSNTSTSSHRRISSQGSATRVLDNKTTEKTGVPSSKQRLSGAPLPSNRQLGRRNTASDIIIGHHQQTLSGGALNMDDNIDVVFDARLVGIQSIAFPTSPSNWSPAADGNTTGSLK